MRDGDEQRLIALYIEITGASEAVARSVLILLDLPRAQVVGPGRAEGFGMNTTAGDNRNDK